MTTTSSRVKEQNYYKNHIHKLKFILLHCKYVSTQSSVYVSRGNDGVGVVDGDAYVLTSDEQTIHWIWRRTHFDRIKNKHTVARSNSYKKTTWAHAWQLTCSRFPSLVCSAQTTAKQERTWDFWQHASLKKKKTYHNKVWLVSHRIDKYLLSFIRLRLHKMWATNTFSSRVSSFVGLALALPLWISLPWKKLKFLLFPFDSVLAHDA